MSEGVGVSEAEAAAIRAIFHRQGEFAAIVELRRPFRGITDAEQARECARTIAGDDLTPEEHRRCGDAADALFREVARRATGKVRP